MKRLVTCFLLILVVLTIGVNAQQNAYDLGGRTIRIQTRWEDVTPLGARGDYNWYEPDARLQAHIESVEKMLNCKIEFVLRGSHHAAAEHLRQGILAGEQPFDFTHVTEGMPDLAVDGLLLPLDDILGPDFHKDFPVHFQRSGLESGLSLGDTIYGFEALNYSQEAFYVFWNKSLFEREGLESLYDIYDRGEWTWDKFAEIAYALTKDTDGDGEIDQQGWRTLNFREEVFSMLVANGARFTYTDENGKVHFDLLKPEFIETIDFMQKLWADGVYGSSGDLYRAAMFFDRGTNISNPGRQTQVFQASSDEWGIIVPPQGPNSRNEINGLTRWVGVIPVYVENPDEVIEVVSALWQTKKPYINDVDEWETSYWERHLWAMYDEESYESLRTPKLTPVLVPSQIEFLIVLGKAKPTIVDISESIIKQGESTTSVLASWQPTVQSIIDEMLKQ